MDNENSPLLRLIRPFCPANNDKRAHGWSSSVVRCGGHVVMKLLLVATYLGDINFPLLVNQSLIMVIIVFANWEVGEIKGEAKKK